MFLDDLSVATGRPPVHPEGPSKAHDVVGALGENPSVDSLAVAIDEGARAAARERVHAAYGTGHKDVGELRALAFH